MKADEGMSLEGAVWWEEVEWLKGAEQPERRMRMIGQSTDEKLVGADTLAKIDFQTLWEVQGTEEVLVVQW